MTKVKDLTKKQVKSLLQEVVTERKRGGREEDFVTASLFIDLPAGGNADITVTGIVSKSTESYDSPGDVEVRNIRLETCDPEDAWDEAEDWIESNTYEAEEALINSGSTEKASDHFRDF